MSNLSDDAGAFDLLLAYPKVYAPFCEFAEELFRGDGPLPVRDRELIFAYVSGLNACDYCHGGHADAAVRLGIDPATFEALAEDVDDAPVDERLKPMLRYVAKLTRTPARMTRRDADAVFAAGWDDAAFHQMIALCGLANYMNRLVDGAGLSAQPDRFAQRGEALASGGYAAAFRNGMAGKAARTAG